MNARAVGFFVFAVLPLGTLRAEGPHWPQFRGVNGSGVAGENMKLPSAFGPDKNVLWKTSLPRGHSSPCIWDERIFLTGSDKDSNKLETLCFDRATGKELWRHAVEASNLEVVHQLNSLASSTPATDGERVYAYFGSFGLVCYDRDGKELWKRELPQIPGRFGSAQSPVVAGEFVVINVGAGNFAFATVAVDRRTGKTVWEKSRARGFAQGLYSTPLVRSVEGGHEVLVVGGQRVCAYNLADGAERWFMTGLPLVSLNSPVAADGHAVFTLSNPIGDGENVVQLPNFQDALAKFDKNSDGKVQISEIPADLTAFTRGRDDKIGDWNPVRQRARMQDEDKDGSLNRDEWQALLDSQSRIAETAAIAVYCIRLGGQGNVSDTHVVWKQTKSAPEVPSPLAYQGRVYLVSEKGIVTCRELNTGKELYRERLGLRGTVYASPVAGDGKIIVASDGGSVAVLKAGNEFSVASRVDFGVPILATPALVDGKIYLRTERELWAFGE